MTNRIFAASYERGIELAAAGCPLDHLDVLPRHSAARRKGFRAEQLAGYAHSRVYALRSSITGFVIALRLGTERVDGTVITHWDFMPSWPEHRICWDYEPADIIPKADLMGDFRSVLDSRLIGVLNDCCLLRRGYPVEGLLCGISYQPIPKCGHGLITGKLSLIDDRGNTVSLRVDLAAIHTAAIRSSKPLQSRVGGLLDKLDEIPVGSKRA